MRCQFKKNNDFKDRPIDVIQYEKQKNKWLKKNEQNLRDLWKTSSIHLCVMSVPKGKRIMQKVAFWKTFQIWWKTWNYTSRSSVNLSRINTKKPMPRHSSLLKDRKSWKQQEKHNSLHSGCLLIGSTGDQKAVEWHVQSAERRKTCLWIILHLAKLSFKNEGEINTFLYKDWENL